jgi:RNA polymerase sigma-70 factor (ECF subfamily)
MGHSESNDTAEWARVLDGDERAFASLFDRHRDRVFRHSVRLSASRHDAEDLTSAAFFELWHRRTRVRIVNDSVLPWLLLTATNLGRNASRALGRYERLFATLPRAVNAEFETAVAERQALLDALGRLSKADAGLLILVSLEGFSVGDAAKVIGISNGAARTRLRRTRIRAQDLLRESPAAIQEVATTGPTDGH